MGLCKNLYTKIGEGSFVSAAEKRFGGYITSPKKKKKVAKPKKDTFITDLLDGLL